MLLAINMARFGTGVDPSWKKYIEKKTKKNNRKFPGFRHHLTLWPRLAKFHKSIAGC